MTDEKEKNEIVQTEGIPLMQAPAEANEVNVDTMIANMEKWIRFQPTLRQYAVNQTRPEDWVDQHGNPYLENNGAVKVATITVPVESLISKV